MYHKGSPTALIGAADHRKRQAAKANLSLCSTKLARHSQHRPAGGSSHRTRIPHRISTGFHPQPSLAGLLPPRKRAIAERRLLCPATSDMLCSHKVTHRSRAERPARAWRGEPHACARPPAGSVLRGRGQVRRRGGHEVVLSACRCSRLKELSKVKVIYWLFSPQGQGFRPSPSCQRHAATPTATTTFPPRHQQAGRRPPVAGAGCRAPFLGEGCSSALVSSCSSSPCPTVLLQNHYLTLPKCLQLRNAAYQECLLPDKHWPGKNPPYVHKLGKGRQEYYKTDTWYFSLKMHVGKEK